MQKFIILAQVFLTNLRRAELLKRGLKKYARDDVKRNHLGKNRRKTRGRKLKGEGGGVNGCSACTRVKRKIGRGRAEITCKNNNGCEYRITRPPAFVPVIGSRVRE